MQPRTTLRVSLCCGLMSVGILVGALSPAARAQGSQIPQGYNSQNWPTANSDAQRDSWVRSDPYVSLESMKKAAGFGVIRKVKLENNSTPGNYPSQAIFEPEAGGYKSMGYLVDGAGNAVGFDSDTSQVFWKNPLSVAASTSGGCSAGFNAGMARMLDGLVPTILPYGGIELGFRTRDRQPVAGGAVGEPHHGATNINEPTAPSTGARGPGFRSPGGGVFVLASDGLLHQLSQLKGYDVVMAPTKFVPANASAMGLIGYDKYLYVATTNNCNGVPNGVWALNLADNSVVSWKTEGADVAGTAGAALGTDGTVYVATGDDKSGSGSFANSVVSLEQKTLKMKDSFSAGKSAFVSTPVVISYKGKDLVAVANKDGKLYLLDGASLGGADHKTALASSTKFTNYTTDYVPGALTSWQDADGNRWVLVSITGAIAAETHFPTTNGNITTGGIVAFKVVEQGGVLTLQPGWASRNMTSPLAPIVVNGVVFAVGSGEYHSSDASLTEAQRAQRSKAAVLYAMDGTTGKELWNSGTALTSYVHSGGLSSLFSTIYLTTSDNTLWAFGLPQDKE
jgi:hypothetical protein